MKIFAPDYYKDFKCIADKCRHSCCIGWDVYIDGETLEKYEKESGVLAERINASLCEKEDGVCFEMLKDGRCPFLNDDGLCDIITQKGDAFIGEICREHPRFYGFYSHLTEMGIGISCEETARVVLSQRGKTELVCIGEDDYEPEEPSEWELLLLKKREELFSLIQKESVSFEKRANGLLATVNVRFPEKDADEWRDILFSLERLDSLWDSYLCLLCDGGKELSELEKPLEKLLLYFVYRHTAESEDERDFCARVAFAYLSYKIIRSICVGKIKKDGKCSLADLCEFARAYSAEIEYSEENTEKLMDILRRLI